jgi:hypothetical protein
MIYSDNREWKPAGQFGLCTKSTDQFVRFFKRCVILLRRRQLSCLPQFGNAICPPTELDDVFDWPLQVTLPFVDLLQTPSYWKERTGTKSIASYFRQG